jgi:nucleoside phosphorylase
LGPAPVEGARVVVPGWLVERLREVDGAAKVGGVATVSTCSGTDVLAARVCERTGAVAEAMEGAAVALVGARLGVAAGEVRVISNTTGERSRQVWDLPTALRGVERFAARLGQLVR